MFRRSATCLKRVAVLGAAGRIGQPLSLLLKNSSLVSSLVCYDLVGSVGVATDLSHICSRAKTIGATRGQIKLALTDADIVVITAGVPLKQGMTSEDLLNVNANVVKNLVGHVADICPEACIAIITNPINSTIPVAARVLQQRGVYNPAKLFGVTTLDIVRAKTFTANMHRIPNPLKVQVNVVGGHAGATIVPLLSQSMLDDGLSDWQLNSLTQRIQFGSTEPTLNGRSCINSTVKPTLPRGSPALSMAYAGSEFVLSLIRALNGAEDVVECAFVDSNLYPELPFFSSRIKLGTSGIEEVLPVGRMSAYENQLLKVCRRQLVEDIAKGLKCMD